MEAKQIILSRGLPKTGSTRNNQLLEDGDTQYGWWMGRDWSTNKTRFILKTIGGHGIVIDRATGLTWARDGDEAGGNEQVSLIWSDAIVYASNLDFAGFTDWRIPNIIELYSIIDMSKNSSPCIYTEFTNSLISNHWSSTTDAFNTSNAKWLNFNKGYISDSVKSTPLPLRCVRGGIRYYE